MGVVHFIDRPNNIIYVVWDAEIDAETWLNELRKLSAEPDWPAISRIITDLQGASANISSDDMEQAAALFGAQLEAVMKKTVAVLARDAFNKARTFSTLVQRFGISMIVFNNLDTACTFLGVNPTDAAQKLEQLRFRLRNGLDLSRI